MKMAKKNYPIGLLLILNKTQPKFSSNLFSESDANVFSVKEVLPEYDENAKEDTDGRMILRDNFDAIFTKYPEALIFGEDAGNIGDVNQGLEGMQEKYGELRVADVGIREAYHYWSRNWNGIARLTPDCRNSIFGLFIVCHPNYE